MDKPVTTNIYNFIAVRAPDVADPDKNVLTIIRDNRMRDTATSAASARQVDRDRAAFHRSVFAQFVLGKISEYLPGLKVSPDVNTRYRLIDACHQRLACEVKGKLVELSVDGFVPGNNYPPPVKTGFAHVDQIVDVLIRSASTEFDKPALILAIHEILRKHDLVDIFDYLETETSADHETRFTRDYYNLYERLYGLYICNRAEPVNLEPVMNGLRALHTVLWLYIELDASRAGGNASGCLGRAWQIIPLAIAYSARGTSSVSNRGSRLYTLIMDWLYRKPTQNKIAPALKIITDFNPDTSFRIQTREDLRRVFYATPYIHPLFANLMYYYVPFNSIKTLGIADLKVVKQQLVGYEVGEIAHIENVLKGEMRERVHRRLDRTEEFTSTERETTEESQRELQTTERFEMQTEAQKAIDESFNVSNQTNVVYKGVVSVDTTFGIGYSRSSQQSDKVAQNSAREITNRTVDRVQKRVREERTKRQIFEVEETNKHGINNKGGRGHVTGIYRFVNKRYRAQVFNYGKRMMFEFMVPQPGAFYLTAFNTISQAALEPDNELPPKPVPPTVSVSEITETTIHEKGYDVDYAPINGILPYPAEIVPEDKSFTIEKGDIKDGSADLPDNGMDAPNYSDTREIAIPEGRYAQIGVLIGVTAWHKHGDNHGTLTVKLGNTERTITVDMVESVQTDSIQTMTYGPGTSYTITATGAKYFKVDFDVRIVAENLTTRIAAWQVDTYAKIWAAYNKKYEDYQKAKTAYDNKKESAKAQLDAVKVHGKNAQINELVIKEELYKHCVTMISLQFDADESYNVTYKGMATRQVNLKEKVAIDYPVIDIDEAKKESRTIQFLHQAFEWHSISYALYPYFWTNEKEWIQKVKMFEENLEDPLFGAFLRAGYARVLVSVRPGYEQAVLHYLYTRQPFNGGDTPGVLDDLYHPVFEELKESQDDIDNAVPTGEPWEYVLPTTLVYLQEGSELPTFPTSIFSK